MTAALISAQDTLRFLTCGSVDDGKSTLIGRLLYDSKLLFDDQLASLRAETERFGTTGDEFDFALLVDGLAAEREQGITIDVAYRFFATPRRRFIVADTPGHEQYTRNMATGASTADLAVLLVDARTGVITQTRRHAYVAGLLGIRHVVLAVNKMDLVDFDAARFAAIEAAFREAVRDLGFTQIAAIPVSARFGDNVSTASERTGWYAGPTLLGYLETARIDDGAADQPLRLPVQWVNRPNADFRGYTGTVAAGRLRAGDEIAVPRTGQTTRIERVVGAGVDREDARAGDAVTITTAGEIDISRGDVLSPPTARPAVSDQLAAHIIWMSETELLPGRPYLLKTGAQNALATVSELTHRIDPDTYHQEPAKTLGLNDIGACKLSLSEPVTFDAYDDSRATGSFILVDRFSNATVAAGMFRFGLRRADNVHWQALDIDKTLRADQLGQRPCVLWFTGLSGAGKSTVANLVEKKLQAAGRHTYLLDGDNIRHGLNRDLGFTDADRVENIRRVAETARLFVDAGLIVLVSFISPFRAERLLARGLVEEGEFVEVFVDAPLDVVEERDPKGLYRKARAGEIANFTGIDSPYEAPESPEIRLPTDSLAPETAADQVIDYLRDRGYLDRG